MIDLATKGGLLLSVGVGYQPNEFAAFGIPVEERATRTNESIDIIRRYRTGERFSFSGKHFQPNDALISPRPMRPMGPPIWMAACTPQGLHRAGRLAHGWIADPVQSLPRQFAESYREAAANNKRKPYICLMRDLIVAPGFAAAEAVSEPTMVTHRFYFKNNSYVPDEYLKDVKRLEDLTFAKAAKDRLIVGSPDECLEQLKIWREAIKLDYLIVRFRRPGGPSHQETLKSIRLLGEKVIPRL